MSFCSRCGREILDESLGCPICSVMTNTKVGAAEPEAAPETPVEAVTENTEEAEVERVDAFTVEDEDGVNQRFEREEDGNRKWGAYDDATPNAGGEFKATAAAPVQTIPTILKVVIIIAVLAVGVVGKIAGLIAGIILLKSPVEDYRKFGKILLIVSGIMLVFSLLILLAVGMFNAALVTTELIQNW